MDVILFPPLLRTVAVYAVIFGVSIAAIPLLVRLATTWQYQRSIAAFLDSSGKPWTQPREPPQIPYTIPWLGQTLSFMDRNVGKMWTDLFAWHPRATGVCSLLIGGKKMHVVFNATTIQAMFKDKRMTRNGTDQQLYENAFAMSKAQAEQAIATKHIEHETNLKYLVRSERVNELTSGFIQFFDKELSKDSPPSSSSITSQKGHETHDLYKWLFPRVFAASTAAFFGSSLLAEYPDFTADFLALDAQLTALFFGLPAFLTRSASTLRDRIFTRLIAWNSRIASQTGIVDPDDESIAWEPAFGSRYNRARQLAYRRRGLNDWSIAGFDFGATFGLNSNAIPATAWMLMHILDPRVDGSLYARVMEELRSAVHSGDGEVFAVEDVDVAALISRPLLQSIWTETLRLYSDVLVFRNLSEDVTLPLDESGERHVLFRKGSDIVAPTWIARNDPTGWRMGSSQDMMVPEEFYAERFLVSKSEPKLDEADEGKSKGDDRKVFSLPQSMAGRFFPFGGGRTICPGRVFAKQEALAALAMVLLRFEFEVVGFVDEKGETTELFPGVATLFPGSAIVTAKGDMRVRIRRR